MRISVVQALDGTGCWNSQCQGTMAVKKQKMLGRLSWLPPPFCEGVFVGYQSIGQTADWVYGHLRFENPKHAIGRRKDHATGY